MLDEFLDELRNPVVFVYVSVLLTWCVTSSTQLSDSVELEFKAYRIQQYDIVGTPYGSRSWKVMYEAVSLDSNALRRCLVVNWRDLLGRDLQNLFGQALGAVLIVLPANLDTLTPATRSKLAALEKSFLYLNTDLAVYVAQQEPELQALVAEVTAFSKRSPTAVRQLLNAIVANTFQFSSSASVSNNIVVPKSANVVGRLWSTERNAPTVIVVAYYDSHSAIPGLAVGSDSNGSGTAALLELLAVFSRFYATFLITAFSTRVGCLRIFAQWNYPLFPYPLHPYFSYRFNIGSLMFSPQLHGIASRGDASGVEPLLASGRRARAMACSVISLLPTVTDGPVESNIELVVCLDSIGKESTLIAHVSKMPAETSAVGRFVSRLKDATLANRTTEIISKKINLNADMLAWEHERYSIRRLPALTLSHFKSHSDSGRNSFLDTPSQVDINVLEANVRTVGEALLSYVLNLPNTKCTHEENVSTCSLLSSGDISRKRLTNWLQRFGSKPRPLAGNSEWLVANLRDTVARYTSSQVTVEPVSVVDVTLYGILDDRLTAHRAKPAVFELLLAIVIAVYLSALYFVAPILQTTVEATLIKLKKL